jgi:hypothetical protein
MNLRKSHLIVLFSIVVMTVGMTSFVEKFTVNILDVPHSFSVQLCIDFYDDHNYSPVPNFLVESHKSTTKKCSLSTFIIASHHYLSALGFICRQIPPVYVNLFSWFDDLLISASRIGYLLAGAIILIAIKVSSFKRMRLLMQKFIFDFSYLQFYRPHSRN